jgi:hypothetical protein
MYDITSRDAGTTGVAGASAPLAFCIFNFVGAERVQTMSVTGAQNFYNRQNWTSLEEVCGGVPPPSRQEFGKVVIHLAKGETESITYGIFGEKLRRNCG